MNSIDINNAIMSQLKVESEWRNNNQDIERVSSLIKQNSMQIDNLNNRLNNIESKIKDKHLTINLVHSNDNKSNENKIYMTDSQFNTLLNKLIINNR
jgi:septal ring factor EnvC (AmiA/AmiB activator)